MSEPVEIRNCANYCHAEYVKDGTLRTHCVRIFGRCVGTYYTMPRAKRIATLWRNLLLRYKDGDS